MTDAFARVATLINEACPLTTEGLEPLGSRNLSFDDAPDLPESLIERLPSIISGCVSQIDHAAERGVFVVSSLTLLSGALPDVVGEYGSTSYSPNIYSIIQGEAGAGKGMAARAARILAPLDERIRASRVIPLIDGPGSRGPTLFLPANSSFAALIAQLSANGGSGVLYDSEIDALSGALAQEWGGGLSHALRQAWEHETVSVARVKDPAPVVVLNPRVTVLLTGTPAQVVRLIPSAEDGLCSRFFFYYATADSRWRSGRPTEASHALGDAVHRAGDLVDGVHEALTVRGRSLPIVLDERGWQLHDAAFGVLKGWGARVAAPKGYVGLVHRSAVTGFRAAMTLAVFRAAEQGTDLSNVDALVAQDEDIEAGVLVGLHNLDHGLRYLMSLPRRGPAVGGSPSARQALLNVLPDKFSGQDVQSAAGPMRIAPRTASAYLNRWQADGLVVSPRYGYYEKVIRT